MGRRDRGSHRPAAAGPIRRSRSACRAAPDATPDIPPEIPARAPKVDLDNAAAAELRRREGIGAERAQAIIENRCYDAATEIVIPMPGPLCFVLMPFGAKPGPGRATIDFDAVYRELIVPAIVAAGLEPLRADEEQAGGIIHKPMVERLMRCDYAVADLTGANANVFHELGLRHGIKPASTVLVFADHGGPLPFDVAPLRALPCRLGPDGRPADATASQQALAHARSAGLDAREQLGLALNRAGRGEVAQRVLLDLIAQRGPSSETCGILGRVYEDRWEAAARRGESFVARGLLDQAIDAYLSGFEAGWRDAYPGVDAVTPMEVKEPPVPRREALIPVAACAVERRIAAGKPDYWDHATLVELGVLGNHEPRAMAALARALAAVRESWEPETTARNLRLIREARAGRGVDVPWARAVETELQRSAMPGAATR